MVEPMGVESVWDYPRPPRLEKVSDRIRVFFNNEAIADSARAYRILETSHPPVYYIPPADIRAELLTPGRGNSFCEFKGSASYWSIRVGDRFSENAAWSYAAPTPAFAEIQDYLAFYPGKVDACFVGDEQAQAQPGGFYGGWVTSRIVGPFKGGPGTQGW